jgi:site-specific DNA-cytosine methylase
MNAPRAIDCQGFAGGFTLGVVQAGFELVAKRENKGGFGVPNCEENRHLLGESWDVEAVTPEEWTVPSGGADLVFGNPPCSGFSVMTSKHLRGEDAKVNQCMWDFIRYVARVRPTIAIFESVSSAYRQGVGLMRRLRAELELLTGDRWDLHHVLHDAYAVGGPAIRKRYFWVASRIPFTVEQPVLDCVPLHRDVIGDLTDMPLTWAKQQYGYRVPSRYVMRENLRSESGYVDGHMPPDVPLHTRIRDLLDSVEWNPREHLAVALERYDQLNGRLPDSFNQDIRPKLHETGFFMGYTQPTMWDPDRPSRVVTGAGPMTIVHYEQKRVLTFREVARILGYPDDWLIEPLAGKPGMSLTWGKGITVQAGRWIAGEAMKALRGEIDLNVELVLGDEDREYVHEVKKPVVKPDTISI